MTRSLLFAILLSAMSPTWAAVPDEMGVRKKIDTQVADLWRKKELAALERLSSDFRTSRARTPSGIWKLSVFNGSLSAQIDGDVRRGTSWQEIHDQASRWARKSPASPLAQLWVAQAWIDHAWSVRGTEYAQSVSPENMATFREYVARARSHLESVKTVASVDPSWYELMLNCTQYGDGSMAETDALFAEAISREPDFLQTYFVASSQFSRKWGGSTDALKGFMTRAVGRFDVRMGDAMYMRIAWWVSDQNLLEAALGSTLDCARMMRGAKYIYSDYPDRWNANNFARFSAQCGDKASTAYFLAKMGPRPMKEVWGRYRAEYLENVKAFAR
jgi:hypothetical protein